MIDTSAKHGSLARFVIEMENYQSNHYGFYNKEILVEAYNLLPIDIKDKISRTPKGLFRGGDSYCDEKTFSSECANKTSPALSFSSNKSLVNAIYGNAKSYYDICASYSDSIDTKKLIKLLGKLKIDHSIGDDEGEVILINVTYLDSMKYSRAKHSGYEP